MNRPGPDQWMELINEYLSSGLSQKEFVAKHDVSFSTFQYWLYRRSRRLSTESGSKARFLPVEVVPSPALEARAEVTRAAPLSETHGVLVELPGGVRVTLGNAVSPQFVGELLRALR